MNRVILIGLVFYLQQGIFQVQDQPVDSCSQRHQSSESNYRHQLQFTSMGKEAYLQPTFDYRENKLRQALSKHNLPATYCYHHKSTVSPPCTYAQCLHRVVQVPAIV